MEDKVLIKKEDRVGIITVNRPEVRNALDKDTFQGLRNAFRDLDEDPDIRVIIVTGAGNKSFVSGADLNILKVRSTAETFRAFNSKVMSEIEAVTKPTIAAINGYAFGGGLELALACDLRICSKTAKLGQTELNVGILPGAGGTQRLTRLVGIGKAKELIFTGKALTADEACKIGLVNVVVEPERLMDLALETAKQIAEKSPLILALAKLVVNEGSNSDLHTALSIERLGQTATFGTEDHLEGINAFLEKRKPEFVGR